MNESLGAVVPPCGDEPQSVCKLLVVGTYGCAMTEADKARESLAVTT
jgi:hypothetical protein